MTKIFQSKTRMFINKCTIRFARHRRTRTRNTNATTLLIVFCLIFCYFVFSNFRCFRFFALSFVNLFLGKAFLTHVNNFRCSLGSLWLLLGLFIANFARRCCSIFGRLCNLPFCMCVCVCIFNAFRGIIKTETIQRTHKSLTTFSKLLCAAQVLFVNAAKFSRSPPFRATHTQQTPRHTHTQGVEASSFVVCCTSLYSISNTLSFFTRLALPRLVNLIDFLGGAQGALTYRVYAAYADDLIQKIHTNTHTH